MSKKNNDLVYFNMAMLPIKLGMAKTEKAYLKEIKRLNVKDASEFIPRGKSAVVHYFTRDGQVTAIMCINLKVNLMKCQIISLLIHEAVHVWQECKEIMGVKLIDGEVEAYAIQWISQQFLNEYLK